MAFFHLVTNEELDQSVKVNFQNNQIVIEFDEALAQRMELKVGGKVMLMLDTEAVPNLLKVSKDVDGKGWEIVKGEGGALAVAARQLVTKTCKGSKKLDAMVSPEGHLVVTMPKTYQISDEAMVRRARKRNDKAGAGVKSEAAE